LFVWYCVEGEVCVDFGDVFGIVGDDGELDYYED